MSSLYTFAPERLEGGTEPLSNYKDQVLLIVNTASKCGFTPQLKGLQELQDQFKDRGFSVLGFPSNQFGRQEPGTADEIGEFCQRNYGVDFPMFAKSDVNGANANPVFSYLTQNAKGVLGSEGIKWNFTKFLVDRQGRVIKRYAPTTTPQAIAADIEKLL